jgi:hypothetical protein
MTTWLVFYAGTGRYRNARLGSVENTPANRAEAHRTMVLHLIQRDVTGTEHYAVLGLR